jgi:uncharacterized membrane protein YdbT with pleckstrin-like domain
MQFSSRVTMFNSDAKGHKSESWSRQNFLRLVVVVVVVVVIIIIIIIIIIWGITYYLTTDSIHVKFVGHNLKV